MPNIDPRKSEGPLFRIYAFEELKPEIDVMAGEVQRLRRSRMTSAEEVRALGSFLDQLRSLAKVAERSATCRERICPELSSCNRELVIMVCILRSNLDQIALRACV
jgi:hypothetical protein